MNAMMSTKRNVSTSPTDRSDDSGVDMSAATYNDNRGHSQYFKRPWLDEDNGHRVAAKRSRTVSGSVPINLTYFPDTAPSAIDYLPKPVPEPLDLSNQRRGQVVPLRQPVPCACYHCVATLKMTPNTASRMVSNAVPGRPPNVVSYNVTDQNSQKLLYSRTMANTRERIRSRNVNDAFKTLKAILPEPSRNQKLSKLNTIKIATTYIMQLTEELSKRGFDGNCKLPSPDGI